MGQHADDLSASLDAEVGSLHDDTDQLGLISNAVSTYAQSLRSMATDLGIGGDTADVAGDSFAALATAIVNTADRFDGVASSAATARAAILQAREDYRALPDGIGPPPALVDVEIAQVLRRYVTAGAMTAARGRPYRVGARGEG